MPHDDTLESLVLAWPVARDTTDVQVLLAYLRQETNKPMPLEQVEQLLANLEHRHLCKRDGQKFWLREPDCREDALYRPLEEALQQPAILAALGLDPQQQLVFQNTATGGTSGDGRLTRPDFTMALIRRWEFDPQRTLDVFSFEVKNHAGLSIASVYEAVAHARMVHYPYLVCPRSRLYPETTEQIRRVCASEQIGMITFRLERAPGEAVQVAVRDLEVVSEASRGSPDPANVQRHLRARLTKPLREKLLTLANG